MRIKALNGGDSYLDMWRKAKEREGKDIEFLKIADTLAEIDGSDGDDNVGGEELDKKNEEFQKLLEVSKEERDRIQRMQVIDRAAAAIAEARSLLEQRKESESLVKSGSGDANSVVKSESSGASSVVKNENGGAVGVPQGGKIYLFMFSCCFSVYIIFLKCDASLCFEMIVCFSRKKLGSLIMEIMGLLL